MISKKEYDEWFRQFWTLTGASTRDHPSPFPLELAYRLVRMFSFVDDVVLDPFCGTGTTMVAAMRCGRHSLGVEIDEKYVAMASRRIEHEASSFLQRVKFEILDVKNLTSSPFVFP